MRITKDPAVRKYEIIMAAKKLFETKGYQKTKIIDITKSINVAKGTFYHYFKSKDEVLEAIVNVTLDQVVDMAKQIEERDIPGLEKIHIFLFSDMVADEIAKSTIEHLEIPENRKLQEMSAVSFINRTSPFIVRYIEQAYQEGKVGNIDHAKERIEMISAAGHFLIDSGLFNDDDDARKERIFVLWDTFEKIFDIPSKPFTTKI